MPYCVRPMHRDDIPQVRIIDREAFPEMLPPPNFERELKNQMSHYYVVCDPDRELDESEVPPMPEKKSGFLDQLKRFFGIEVPATPVKPVSCRYICGYVGFWVLADEAHITTIAVKEEHQRQGFGELLMMAVFNRAKELYASEVTLEVRVSNTRAQRLYLKYGFKEVGRRKGYYTDNREDAFIMTTDDITTPEGKKLLAGLMKAYFDAKGKVKFFLAEN